MQATVRTCGERDGTRGPCGPESAVSNPLLILPQVCSPSRSEAIGGPGVVTFRWNRQPLATGYRLQSPDGTGQAETTNNYLVVETDVPWRIYRAISSLGPGGPSIGITSAGARIRDVTPVITTLPTVAAEPTADADDDALLIQFHEGSVTTTPNALYEIMMWNQTAEQWAKLPFTERGQDDAYSLDFTWGDNPTARVGNLNEDRQRYCFRARAINGDRKSKWTRVFKGDFPAPDEIHPDRAASREECGEGPTELQATAEGTAVNLTWTKHTNTAYTSQVLLRRVAGVSDWTELSLDADAESYRDEGLYGGIKYIYRVRAEKPGRGGEDSDPAEISVPKVPPTNLAASVSGTEVSLTWTAHNNRSFISQVVKRRVAGETPVSWTNTTIDKTATSHTDTTAVSGTTYIYRVQGKTPTSGDNAFMSGPVEVAVR